MLGQVLPLKCEMIAGSLPFIVGISGKDDKVMEMGVVMGNVSKQYSLWRYEDTLSTLSRRLMSIVHNVEKINISYVQ